MDDTRSTGARPSAERPKARLRKTSRRVRWVDRWTSIGITAGGFLVIVCVLGIFVYLVGVVVPLFRGASLSDRRSLPALEPERAERSLFCQLDEYRALGACLLATGELELFSVATGGNIERRELWPADARPAAFALDARSGRIAIARLDGQIQLGRIAFETRFLTADEAAAAPASMARASVMAVAGGVLERTVGGALRQTSVSAALEPPLSIGDGAVAIRRIDYRPSDEQAQLALWLADGRLLAVELGGEKNFLTGEVEASIAVTALPPPPGERGDPDFLRINSRGDELYVAWKDGQVGRYDLRDRTRPELIESADLVEGAGVELTALDWILGERSLLAGDSAGGVSSWSRVQVDDNPPEGAPVPPPADGFWLARVHRVKEGAGAAITAIATSQRDKSFLVGHSDGRVAVHHLTSERLLAETRIEGGGAVRSLQMAPKGDGIFALGANGTATVWALSNPHPETTLASLFGRVWYEGFARPEHVWQSSSGTDDFEPKLGLLPLVFGTLKATFYSMLFAVPIALAAALYTSEFLDHRFRGTVKTTLELMASLPSVVLGFLAALVLAPLVEHSVLGILTAFALLPVVALGFGYLLQMAPTSFTLRLRGRIQFVILLGLLVATALLAGPLASLLERLLFAGDFKAWLDGRAGSGRAGLGLLIWPLALIGLIAVDRAWLVPRLGRRGLSRNHTVLIEAGKFAALVVLSIGLAAGLAIIGFALGFDPRGVLLGTYVQRNALVVGFVMGFAVIPIVYTLSEDALSSVPQSLRSASLGCGATRWQTATRVVLPVALPGIFSALMVGLGRAVGETMIVLMAAGNTPVIDLNLFSGLRTLSANIAVELPEAVKDGTLYRVLFLAALTLFLLTFFFNTLAELVRQRLRKRYAQL